MVGKTKKSILQVKDVTKKFGKKIILNHINLEVREGEILSIIGSNGSGKTTLLKLLIGYLKPEKGNIYYNNKDISNYPKKCAIDFGFATQENSFYPNLTTEENLRFFGRLYNIEYKTLEHNVKTALKLVSLEDSADVLAKNLSSGMKRRLDVACSIVNNPKILILDEPTEDLDIFLRKEMIKLIKKINQAGTTIVMTSHQLDTIEQTSDRVAILYKHTVIEQGPLSLLRSLSKKRSLDQVFAQLIKDA